MEWAVKAMRHFLLAWVGAKVASKSLCQVCGWDFRKYVSILRKKGVKISRAEHVKGKPAHVNFYVMTEMPDEDTIADVLYEPWKEFSDADLANFSSM